MPSKDFFKMKKIIEIVHSHRESLDDKYYDGVPLIVLSNLIGCGLHKAYLLAKQAELYDSAIRYKKGKVLYDGG